MGPLHSQTVVTEGLRQAVFRELLLQVRIDGLHENRIGAIDRAFEITTQLRTLVVYHESIIAQSGDPGSLPQRERQVGIAAVMVASAGAQTGSAKSVIRRQEPGFLSSPKVVRHAKMLNGTGRYRDWLRLGAKPIYVGMDDLRSGNPL